ncbi:PQQ-binding-like beta-propeller repeat protein [Galbitalea soli]|uniref:PQQ-binding-like beta-propeller repeat protein n=1 Tax=Galbitalea soli TaxID=1268042 RepID=A0A7C9PLL5_9MICO|nr:PQQ-binding-like beta-propeller repeat protein [Galbitalea soli]NEM90128.1 PQQ-binding-like beta-propeller repeat protein [Galbitalea soli]NYJ30836.1 hypothetical protein [Galbitalea soli]
MSMLRRTRTILAAGVIAAIALVPAVTATSASAMVMDPVKSTDILALSWTRHYADNGLPFWYGSPGVAYLDGNGSRPSIVVGDEKGYIWALHADDGSAVAGWPYRFGAAVMSTPSSIGHGATAMVFVGTGESPHPTLGAYAALHANGTKAWALSPYLLPGNRGGHRGVMSSLAVGSIQHSVDVVGGAMGQMQYALRGTNGRPLLGFPWLQADTNFSTPAVSNVAGDSRDEIIEGGDSTQGIAGIYHYTNGGHIRILSSTGNAGKRYKNQGLVCQYNTTEVVQSSPAVGGFLASGRTGIVVGTGHFYKTASDRYKVIAIDTSCRKQWAASLDGNTGGSPALAMGIGPGTNGDHLNVVMMSARGTVYALDGATGHRIWSTALGEENESSVTTFRAGSETYIIAPTLHGAYILKGSTGEVVQRIGDLRMRNAATVTLDRTTNGHKVIGVTIAGSKSTGPNGLMQGWVEHFVLKDPALRDPAPGIDLGAGQWPMFHHDAQLTGDIATVARQY